VYQRRGENVILRPENTQYDVQIFSVRELQWVYPVMKVIIDMYH
jgi:hypothetical protein